VKVCKLLCCGYELPTQLQNFTEVKIFEQILRGYFFRKHTVVLGEVQGILWCSHWLLYSRHHALAVYLFVFVVYTSVHDYVEHSDVSCSSDIGGSGLRITEWPTSEDDMVAVGAWPTTVSIRAIRRRYYDAAVTSESLVTAASSAN